MGRPGLCFTILVVMFLSSGPGSPHDKAVSADPLTPDVYSLYSTIYQAGPGSGELLGITASPLPLKDSLTCLKPSTPEEQEMVEAAKDQLVGPIEWKRQFNFGRAYTLIPPGQVTKAIDCIQFSGKGTPAGCKPYSGLRYVRFLSIPVFNRDHTRALVATARICGGLCGSGGAFVYRKTTQGWELETGSFAKCAWIS